MQQLAKSVLLKCLLAINFLIKKTSGGTVNKELTEELHKPIIRKFEKRKVYFIDINLGADLADMQLISQFHKGFRFLFCDFDIYSKCASVIPWKVKKELQLLILFKKF